MCTFKVAKRSWGKNNLGEKWAKSGTFLVYD